MDLSTATKLYGPHSRALRIRAVAAWAGVDVESHRPFTEGVTNRTSWFLEKSPLGTTPLLETSDGTCVFESDAICRFLAAKCGNALYPANDDAVRARIDEWLRSFDALDCVGPGWLYPVLGIGADRGIAFDAVKERDAKRTLRAFLGILQSHFGEGGVPFSYLVRAEISLADVVGAAQLATPYANLLSPDDWAPFPDALRWLERVVNHPTWIAALGKVPKCATPLTRAAPGADVPVAAWPPELAEMRRETDERLRRASEAARLAAAKDAACEDSTKRFFSAIPVIDVSSLCRRAAAEGSEGSEEASCASCASNASDRAAVLKTSRELADACRDVGFFYAVGHGVDATVYDGVRDAAREWFDRPLEHKSRHAITPESAGRGYQPLGANVTRHERGFARDWHEAVDVYKDFEENDPDVLAKKPLHVPNPRLTDAAAFEGALRAWRDEALRVGAEILRGIAIGLGLDDDFFARETTASDPFFVMRAIRYPPLPTTTAAAEDRADDDDAAAAETTTTTGANAHAHAHAIAAPSETDVAAAKRGDDLSKAVPISCGEHCDYGLLTLVNQDPGVRALQVKNARGEWVDAPPIEGAFVCNIGDMLELYTNGVCRSTTHRVLMPSAEEAADGRISVPFFFEPNFDAIVSPLAAFGDVHEKYATPVKYGEHLRRKIEANFETDRVTMRARES